MTHYRGSPPYGLIAVAGCQLFYFNALARIPVGVALLLEYLGTVLVVGVAVAAARRAARRPTAGRPQDARAEPAR